MTDVTHLTNIFICGPPPLCKLGLSDTDHRYIDQGCDISNGGGA